MSSIVLELQADAMGHSGSVLGLLRKTLVIATKLSTENVKAWATSEMEGYKTNVPDYRQFVGIIKAYNPYHGWQPVFFKEETVSIKETLSAVSIYNAVAEVEAWIVSNGETLQHPLPTEIAYELLGVPIEMSVFFAKSALSIIPDRIRSFVLNWSLELESKGILGEGMTFTVQEKSKATTVITNNFYAPQYQNSGTVGAMGDAAAAAGS